MTTENNENKSREAANGWVSGKEIEENQEKLRLAHQQPASEHTEKEPKGQCAVFCGLNYCDENGCMERVRHLVDPINILKPAKPVKGEIPEFATPEKIEKAKQEASKWITELEIENKAIDYATENPGDSWLGSKTDFIEGAKFGISIAQSALTAAQTRIKELEAKVEELTKYRAAFYDV